MENEFVNFEDLRNNLEIKDSVILQTYLTEIYKDLSSRQDSDLEKGISKKTFSEYYRIQSFICDKLFSSFDKDCDSFLNFDEFTLGLNGLFLGNFEETCEIIFNLFDFDKDGQVDRGDVKILLSYLPLKKIKTCEYKNQMEGLSEIDEIVSLTFGDKIRLNLEEFMNITTDVKSDVYLQSLCYFYINRPFTKMNMDIVEKLQTINISSSSNKTLKKVRFPSPSRSSKIPCADKFLRRSSANCSSDDEDNNTKTNSRKVNQVNCPDVRSYLRKEKKSKTTMMNFDNFIRMANTKVIPKKLSNGTDDVRTLLKISQNRVKSPTKYLTQGIENKNSEFSLNIIPLSDEENTKESFKKDDTNYKGWLYRQDVDGMQRYWCVIADKDIYFYKDNLSTDFIFMQNLSGCFIKENQMTEISEEKFYSFSLLFSTYTQEYNTDSYVDYITWIAALKKGIGYQNFFDYYSVLNDIGQGQFGLVKLGQHKKTGEKVAIKIISKKELNVTDFELVRFEIDIMKLCKHENVVRLLEHFENPDYIFIVMEYLDGGDLFQYLHDSRSYLDERRMASITNQIACGIRYLHQYGITHRDIKPDNIMLSLTKMNQDGYVIKLMDFGLSKILGPKERALESYGTLSYVAPEILLRKPYNKQVDIWSLGITLYFMSSGGLLPFDDESNDDAIIAKKTAFGHLNFPGKYFDDKSIELVELIGQCLVKDPNKRITIDEVLHHDWLKKYS